MTNYELDDHNDQKKSVLGGVPVSEEEAVKLALAEDEARARKLGLKREAGTPVGKNWTDNIGGGLSPEAKATRLLQEEAKVKAKRAAEAKGAATSVLMLAGILGVAVGIGALAADYTGLVNLGIFAKPDPPPVMVSTERPKAEPAPVEHPQPMRLASRPTQDPIPVQAPTPDAAPMPVAPVEEKAVKPATDPAAIRKAESRVKSKQNGVDLVSKDLAAVRGRINDNLRLFYGFVPNPRDVVPKRTTWVPPCAAISLERIEGEPVTESNRMDHLVQLQNIRATIVNINNRLAFDRKLESEIMIRLQKADRELADAKSKLAELQ